MNSRLRLAGAAEGAHHVRAAAGRLDDLVARVTVPLKQLVLIAILEATVVDGRYSQTPSYNQVADLGSYILQTHIHCKLETT